MTAEQRAAGAAGRRPVTLLASLLLLVSFTGAAACHLWYPLDRDFRGARSRIEKGPQKDCIVVLAGEYGGRARAAARLYRAGCGRWIVLANDGVRKGWSRKYQRNLLAIELAEDLLAREGVPPSAIIRLPFLQSGTVFDALQARRFATVRRLRSMIVVTSDYHCRRAGWIFSRVAAGSGISIDLYPAAFSAPFGRCLGEGAKMLYYLARYGLLGLPNLPR